MCEFPVDFVGCVFGFFNEVNLGGLFDHSLHRSNNNGDLKSSPVIPLLVTEAVNVSSF